MGPVFLKIVLKVPNVRVDHGDSPGQREVLRCPLEDMPARQDAHEQITDPRVQRLSLRPVERVRRYLKSTNHDHVTRTRRWVVVTGGVG